MQQAFLRLNFDFLTWHKSANQFSFSLILKVISMNSFLNTNYFYKYHVNVHKIDKLGLYNSLQIHSPVYFNFCRLMPVLKPACYNA